MLLPISTPEAHQSIYLLKTSEIILCANQNNKFDFIYMICCVDNNGIKSAELAN